MKSAQFVKKMPFFHAAKPKNRALQADRTRRKGGAALYPFVIDSLH
jgi:hypothetical protein